MPATTRTKLVATLGPASEDEETLRALVEAGVDVFRLNFSHGTHEEHAARAERVRAVAERAGIVVGLLQDLPGPKLRTGLLRGGGPVELRDGATLVLQGGDEPGDAQRVATSYEPLAREVRAGDRILVSDGLIALRVEEVRGGDVVTRVERGGSLRERQGLHLPGVALRAPALTDKDRADLAAGARLEVDWVALSFVRRAEDLRELKSLLAEAGRDTPVLAKIEKSEALDDLDAILAEADGIMVARGDLGVEITPERVPPAQKRLCREARRRGLPVVTATEMLQSMIEQPRPTRAEASDVANAVLDGSDAVMLSGETAIGRHPVEAARAALRIAAEIEREYRPARTSPGELPAEAVDDPEAIASAVAAIVRDAPSVRAVCIYSLSGLTARLVSALRLPVPVLAFSSRVEVLRRMALYWGVVPCPVDTDGDDAALERRMLAHARRSGAVAAGERVVLTGSLPLRDESPTNFLKLVRA